MGLSERKITTWTKPISSLADRPQMSAAELKAAFDSNANEIKPKFNGLVDDLTGAGGASEIGASLDGVAGTNVQALLAALKALIDLRETTASTDEKLSEKANQTTVNKTFKDISVNESTGVVTLTCVDGTTKAVNTSLSKIAVNFGFDAEMQKITLMLNDGTTQHIDVSAFIKPNEIVDSDNIVVARNADGTVSLSVKSGSINAEMLTSTILDELKAYRDAAAISAQNAAASESNAQTYKNAAANFSQSAQDALNETIQHKNTAYLHSQAALESKNAAAASATEAGQQAGSASGFAARAEEALSKMGVHIGSGAPANGAKLWLCPVNNPLVMNPDRATSDMTQEVGVNDDGKLVTTVEDGSISESKLAQDVKDKFRSLSEEIANLQTSGLTTAQINALDGMFKVAAYDDSKDVSGAYAAFKAAFGLVDSGVTTYTITADLVNVTSSNSATSITEGESYTATLTAADGYALDTVTVTMGGVDVTADVYADGVISISSATGNVKITASASEETVGAVLPEDGLLAFWDLRNATSTTDWTPTIGDAATYKLQSVNTWDAQTVDSHGVLLSNGTHGGAKIQKADETGNFTDMEHGSAFTIVTMGYSPEDMAVIGTHASLDGFKKWYLHAHYTNTEGTSVLAKSVQTEVLAVGGTYCPEIYRVDGTQMSLHLYGTQWIDEDGSSYDSFDHWNDGPFTIRSIKNYPSAYLTAVAIYNRALTDVEVVEIGEYLKTLEVST